MNLFLDQCVQFTATERLLGLAQNAAHASELQMSRAADRSIRAYARPHDMTNVTFDSDFHAILAIDGAAAPSVIRLRVEALDAQTAAELINRVLKICEPSLRSGGIIGVHGKDGRSRIVMLPLPQMSTSP